MLQPYPEQPRERRDETSPEVARRLDVLQRRVAALSADLRKHTPSPQAATNGGGAGRMDAGTGDVAEGVRLLDAIVDAARRAADVCKAD